LPPPADAHVHVVALREDPAVPAGDSRELEVQRPAPVSRWKLVVGEVALERDTVDDLAAQPERARGHAIRTVGADQCIDLDRLAVHAEASIRLDRGPHAVPEDHARLD